LVELLDNINNTTLKELTDSELSALMLQIRERLIQNVANTGGHLASNLGVVELTVALHRVLELDEDKLIWDTGHQSYVHKMLTERGALLPTLRKEGGLAGFPKRSESKYDHYDTGHTGSSISAALGMAHARDISNEDYKVAVVIGDGALSEGVALEGLNNCGELSSQLLIVFNDNGMSISKNVGGFAKRLTKMRTSSRYKLTKSRFKKAFLSVPLVGKPLMKFFDRSKDALRSLFLPKTMFEEFGVTYLGPVDGHNVEDMSQIFRKALELNTPVLVHVRTVKGRGYESAEYNPEKYHSVRAYSSSKSTTCISFTQAFGDAICHIANSNKGVAGITAAMCTGTGLDKFSKLYNERFFDVGISEQHAVTFAAGLALTGMRPVVAIYSSFLQRSVDQIISDVCLQRLPVVLCLDHAGFVGEDGETHHGLFDISYLTMAPYMRVYAPAFPHELLPMLEECIKSDSPCAIRYPKDITLTEDDSLLNDSLKPISNTEPFIREARLGNGERKICVVALGVMLQEAYKAAKRLCGQGFTVDVIEVGVISPSSTNILSSLNTRGYELLVTVEEGIIKGGFGEGLRSIITACPVITVGVENPFIPQMSVTRQRELAGIDAEGIYGKIKGRLGF